MTTSSWNPSFIYEQNYQILYCEKRDVTPKKIHVQSQYYNVFRAAKRTYFVHAVVIEALVTCYTI